MTRDPLANLSHFEKYALSIGGTEFRWVPIPDDVTGADLDQILAKRAGQIDYDDVREVEGEDGLVVLLTVFGAFDPQRPLRRKWR